MEIILKKPVAEYLSRSNVIQPTRELWPTLCRHMILLATLVVGSSAIAVEIPIFVIAGQSNAVGAGTNYLQLSSNLQAAQANVLYSGPQQTAVSWASLLPPTQLYQTDSFHGFGPEITVGKTISDAWGGKSVGETKFAVSATNLHTDWNPNISGSLYYQMLARVDDALAKLPIQKPGYTGKVAGIFWMQGETDGVDLRTTEQYQADLTGLIAHLRTDFNNPELPFVYGQITTFWPNAAEIRLAQANVAETVPYTFMLDTDMFDRIGAHYTSQGTVDMGVGFGNGFISIVPEPETYVLMLAGLGVLGLIRRKKIVAELG